MKEIDVTLDLGLMKAKLYDKIMQFLDTIADDQLDIAAMERLRNRQAEATVVDIPTYADQAAIGKILQAEARKVIRKKHRTPKADREIMLKAALNFIAHRSKGSTTEDITKYLINVGAVPKGMKPISVTTIVRDIMQQARSKHLIVVKLDVPGRAAGYHFFPIVKKAKVAPKVAAPKSNGKATKSGNIVKIRQILTDELVDANEPMTIRDLTNVLRGKGFPEKQHGDKISNMTARILRDMATKNVIKRSKRHISGVGDQVFYTINRPTVAVTKATAEQASSAE